MNILNLLSGGVLEGIARIADEFITTDKEKMELELKAKQLEVEEFKIQAELLEKVHETNIAEAKNPNWFVAGWRPFIGWIGGLALGYTFIGQPLIEWGVKLLGKNITPPIIDTGMLFNLVIAMLGLGGLRTFEKYKGVVNKH